MTLLARRRRGRAWFGLALLAALLGTTQAAWSLGLVDSSWPMFRHDVRHSGRTGAPAPSVPAMRWWQPTGGPVFASPVISGDEGIRKIWYLHSETWRDTPPVRPADPAAPDIMRLDSHALDAAQSEQSVTVTSGTDECLVAFETSSALAGSLWDPFRTSVPAGTWRFVYWGYASSAATVRVYFKVYRFAQGAPDTPVQVFATAPTDSVRLGVDPGQYTVEYSAPAFDLAYTDGLRVEMWVTSSSGSPTATVRLEGETRTRVETPIWEKCVIGGSDDGALYALEASSGNVFWSVKPTAGRIRGAAAIDDENVSYVGVEQDAGSDIYSQGRLYAVKPDGSIKWIYPSYRPKMYLRSTAGTVGTTAKLDTIFGNADDATSGCQPGADTTNFYLLTPRAENAAGVAALPAAITGTGWISERDWVGRQLVPGEFQLNLALRATNCGAALPEGELYYRISKVTANTGSVVRVVELVGWTASETLRPTAQYDAGNPEGTTLYTEIHTAEVAGTTFAANECLYIEFAIKQSIGSVAGAGWHLVVENQDSTIITSGLVSSTIRAVTTSPAVTDDGVVYFATLGGWIYALENDGTLRWEKQIPSMEEIRSSPAVAPATSTTPGRVYVAGMDGKLYALDGDTGGFYGGAWPVDVGAPVEASPAIAADGTVYVCTNRTDDGATNGRLLAVNGSTGAVNWTYSPPSGTPASLAASPAISTDGETIYVGSDDGHLYAVDREGSLQWQFPAAGDVAVVRSSPLVASGRARDKLWLGNDGLLTLAAPAFPLSETLNTGTGTGYLLFRQSGGLMASLPTGAPQYGWVDEVARGSQTLTAGPWRLGLTYSKIAAGEVRQQGYLWYRITKYNPTSGAFSVLLNWTRLNEPLSALDTATHTLVIDTPTIPGTTFTGDQRIALEVAIQQTAGGADSSDGWRLGAVTSIEDYVQTATLGGEQIYFGAGDGHVYCLYPNGAARWSWMPDRGGTQGAALLSSPAVTTVNQEEFMYLRAVAGTAPGTAIMDPVAGEAADWNTVVVVNDTRSVAGSPQYIQFMPSATNAAFAPALPAAITQRGWISERDRSDRTWAQGKWQVSVAYQVNTLAQPVGAYLWYRLSKVRLNGGLVERVSTLLDWHRHSTAALTPIGTTAERLVFDTATVPQVTFGAGEYPYVELALEPTTAGAPGLTWSLELEQAREFIRSTGASDEPILYIGCMDYQYYAVGPVGPSGLVPGGITLPELPDWGPAQVHLTKSADKNLGNTGDNVTYTIRVRNDAPPDFAGGTTTAVGLQVQDPVPTGMSYVSGGTDVGGVVTFDVGDLAPGGTMSVSWVGRIDISGTDPVNPQVVVNDSDPLQPPATTNNTYRWGQGLFLDLTGRGVPGVIENVATATANAGAVEGTSNTIRTEVGWGHRYRLTFYYDGNINPSSPAGPPVNQPVVVQTVVDLNGSNEYAARAEEAVEPGTPADRTVFKLELSPKGFPYSANAASVTQPPNRPWTPYHWQVAVQQVRSQDGADAWGDPWTPTRAAATSSDFSVSNPLAMTQPTGTIATAKADLHAGTTTNGWGYDGLPGNPAFIMQNASMFSMSASSPTRPTNALRWDATSLAGTPFGGAGYNSYDESFLPGRSIHFLRDYANVGRGGVAASYLWATVPRYQAPSVYSSATAAVPPAQTAGILPIYMDLNGSGSWDPGEALFEYYGATTTRNFFQLGGVVLEEPQLRPLEATIDLSRQPHGSSVPAALTLLNEGNVTLAGGGGATLTMPSPIVGRSDLPEQWPDPLARPLDWTLSATLTDPFAKTPVGSMNPMPYPLTLDTAGALPDDQPVGHYAGTVVLGAHGAVTNLTEVPITVDVGERRVMRDLGDTTPAVGADVYPYALWLDDDHLQLYWSSNRKADNSAPGPADPFYLYGNNWDRSVTPAVWSTDQSFPAAGSDRLDEPAGTVVTRRHLTPGLGVDDQGHYWLYWGGQSIRNNGGANTTDNRLLWTDLTAGGPIYQSPNPGPTATPSVEPPANPAAASGSARLYPRPLGWTTARVTDDNLRMVSRAMKAVFAQGTGDRWHLVMSSQRSEQRRDDANLPWGAASTPVYEELALPLGTDLISAQQPSLVQGIPRTYFLHAEEAKNQSTLRRLDTWGPDHAVDQITANGAGSEALVASFLTDPGEPRLAALPAGMWWFEVMAQSSGGGSLTFRAFQADQYGTKQGGALFETVSDALPATAAMVEARHQQVAPIPVAADSRLLIEVWASSGAGDVQLWCDGISGSRFTMPVYDTLGNIVFSGRSNQHGNSDLYWARFDPNLAADDESRGLSAFPYVGEYLDPIDTTGRVFVTRHKRWLLGARGDVMIHVGGTEIAGTLGNYDKGTNDYTISASTAGRVKVNPDSGRIEFLDTVPAGQVLVYYAPRLLRLTEHAGNDLSPAAFVETYRYRDPDTGTPLPGEFRPRLWVVWVRSGGPGLANALYWKTYRLSTTMWSPGWLPEQRQNSADQRWDAGETLVPVDHAANEFGLAACKDPKYAQVWLFWSSTRGKPPTGGPAEQYDTDLYYEAISPPLSDE